MYDRCIVVAVTGRHGRGHHLDIESWVAANVWKMQESGQVNVTCDVEVIWNGNGDLDLGHGEVVKGFVENISSLESMSGEIPALKGQVLEAVRSIGAHRGGQKDSLPSVCRNLLLLGPWRSDGLGVFHDRRITAELVRRMITCCEE